MRWSTRPSRSRSTSGAAWSSPGSSCAPRCRAAHRRSRSSGRAASISSAPSPSSTGRPLGAGGRHAAPAAGRDRRPCASAGAGIAAQITQLVAAGGGLLVLCADAAARHRHLAGRLGGFSLASYDALERGAATTHGYRHVLLLDPPAGDAQRGHAAASGPQSRTVMAWGPAELRFAEHIHEREYGLRDPLAACYRTLRDRGGAAGQDFEAALRGDGPQQRSPELAGRLLRVLAEIGLIELWTASGSATGAVTRSRVGGAGRRATLEDSARRTAYRQREYEGRTEIPGLTSGRRASGRRPDQRTGGAAGAPSA